MPIGTGNARPVALDEVFAAALAWEGPDYQEAVKVIRLGYADFKAERVRPIEKSLEELRESMVGLVKQTAQSDRDLDPIPKMAASRVARRNGLRWFNGLKQRLPKLDREGKRVREVTPGVSPRPFWRNLFIFAICDIAYIAVILAILLMFPNHTILNSSSFAEAFATVVINVYAGVGALAAFVTAYGFPQIRLRAVWIVGAVLPLATILIFLIALALRR